MPILSRRTTTTAELLVVLLALAVRPASGEPPAWARIEEAPLFSFAWLTDMHLDASRQELIIKALRYVDEELKPRFVLITGDNNALAAPPARPDAAEPIGLRRQRFLKDFLGQHLQTPYAIIPGDNWPEGFEEVFGSMQYSFDCGGLHFLLLAPDRRCRVPKSEGLATLDEATWTWLRGDLDRHRGQPVLVAIHEPIFPPTFLDAKRLQDLLDEHPNVLAALQGHVHTDGEFRSRGRTYFLGPALGPTARPAMKQVLVYRHLLAIRTIRYRADTGQFAMSDKWQRIGVPEPLRSGLARPADPRFTMLGYDAVPPHALFEDSALARRRGELFGLIKGFVIGGFFE